MPYPVTGVGLPAAMWALSGADNWLAAKTVAGDARCPGDLLESLVYNPHPQALTGIVENSACPEELMLRLTGTGSAPNSPANNDPAEKAYVNCLRIEAAYNPDCGPRLLQMLSAHTNPPHIRAAAAAHPACPPHTRTSLKKDDNLDISEAAAAASTTIPRRVLRRITQDPRKPSLISRVLDRHAGPHIEPHWNIMALASNPASPPEVLDQIARDADFDSKAGRAAAANPACAAHTRSLFAAHHHPGVKLIAEASSQSTTPRRIARLAAHPDPCVAAVAANNPACPQDSLDRLARHPRWQIRSAAIANPNASPQIRALAVSDAHLGVRRLAAHIGRTPQ